MKTLPLKEKLAIMALASIVFVMLILCTSSVGRVNATPDNFNTPLWIYQTEGTPYSVAISSDGSYIATQGSNKVYLFSRTDNHPLWSYDTGDAVYSVSISSDGSHIAAGGRNKVYLFSKDNSIPLWSYTTNTNVYSVSISSDGNYIVAGSGAYAANGRVYLFSKTDNTLLWSYVTIGNVFSLSISSDGSYIAAGSDDYNVYFFSKADNTLLWKYTTDGDVFSVSISSDGSYTAAGSDSGTVYLFSNADNTPLWTYATHSDIYSVSISSDGSYITVGNFNNVYLFSKDNSSPLWSYDTGWLVISVSISSDGNYIVAGTYTQGDSKVYLFSNDNDNPLWDYTTSGNVESLSISSDGSCIAASSADNKVYFFKEVTPNISPTASFTYSPSSPTTDDTIQFTDQSTDNDGTIVSWHWNFGDGATSTSKNPSHKYPSAGTYPISLTVTDNGGASDTENKLITISTVTRVPTKITISPSSFELQPGQSRTLTATLNDNYNHPLANKTISWTKTAGSLSPTSGTTNSSGQVSVTYTASSYETTVTVTASFAGDNQYEASSKNSLGTVVKASTTLTITPSTFTLQPGNSATLTAALTSNGGPLVGKIIIWSATLGEVVPSIGSTNSLGQVAVTYTAPSYENSVVITTTFAGDSMYQASSGSSSGVIKTAPPLQAIIDIKPDTLKMGSGGRWITCYIELPTDNVRRIDVSSILLEETILVDPSAPTEIGDYDNDGAPDLMIKFDRQSVEDIVNPGPASLTVTGNVGESTFIGADRIDVIRTGPGALVSARSGVSGGVPEVREEVYNLDLNITAEAGENKVTINVSSEVSTGTTIVVNIDSTVVAISSLEDLKVMVDNREIRLADNYEDIFDTTDENEPEYLVFLGAEGIQVLVSIPHFSIHTIVIGNAAAVAPPPQEAGTPPAGGIPIAVVLTIAGVALVLIISAAWISHRRGLEEATSELLEYGLSSMRLQEVDIFREIREKKEFSIPEIMRQTGASKTVAWRTVQKLIKKGLVKPTDKVVTPAAGRGKPSTVYKYVGD